MSVLHAWASESVDKCENFIINYALLRGKSAPFIVLYILSGILWCRQVINVKSKKIQRIPKKAPPPPEGTDNVFTKPCILLCILFLLLRELIVLVKSGLIRTINICKHFHVSHWLKSLYFTRADDIMWIFYFYQHSV